MAGIIQAILGGRGQEIDRSQAVAGDLWTDGRGDQHVGIVWEANENGAKTILSNSSGSATFTWVSSVEFMGAYYKNTGNRFFRITN